LSRRKISIAFGGVVDAVGSLDDSDATTTLILDATEALLRELGLRRWSLDDVAERAGIGRTSIYRHFDSRDDLVHAVLARELRTTLDEIGAAAEQHDSIEDRVVAGAALSLGRLRHSVVERLLQTDPDTFLPFLTLRAGPLLALARTTLAAQLRLLEPGLEPAHAEEVAEVAARLGLSFVLTRDTAFPLDDPRAASAAIERLVRPVLRTLTTTDHR